MSAPCGSRRSAEPYVPEAVNLVRTFICMCAVALLSAAPAAAQDAPFSLRDDADRAGVHLGAAVMSRHLEDPALAALARQHVNTLVFENEAKWATVHPEPDRYDFTGADRIARVRAAQRDDDARAHADLARRDAGMAQGAGPDPATRRSRSCATTSSPSSATSARSSPVSSRSGTSSTRGSTTTRPAARTSGSGGSATTTWTWRSAGPARRRGRTCELFYNDYFDAGMTAGAEAIGGDFDDGDAVAVGAARGDRRALLRRGREVRRGARARDRHGRARRADRRGRLPGAPRRPGPLGPPRPHRVGRRARPRVGADRARRAAAGGHRGARPRRTARRRATGCVASACIDDPACDTIVTWGLSDRYTWWRTSFPAASSRRRFTSTRTTRRSPRRFALHDVLAAAPPTPAAADLRIASRSRGGHRLRVRLHGNDLASVEAVRWRLGPCARVRGRGERFGAALRPCDEIAGRGRARLRAKVRLAGGERKTLSRRVRLTTS